MVGVLTMSAEDRALIAIATANEAAKEIPSGDREALLRISERYSRGGKDYEMLKVRRQGG